jgi:hypothetical protein
VNLTTRYSFLTEDYEGYSGMAKYAREKLVDDGTLKARAEAGEIPFYMDLIGAAQGDKHFIGVSYFGTFPMTTYEQADAIVGELEDAGIKNQVVNYQGWFNRGYFHDVPDKIKPVGALGNVGDLEKLSSRLDEMGGALYSDVSLQRVTFTSKRYNYPLETARYYSSGVASFGVVSPISYMNVSGLGYTEVLYDVLSPRFLGRYTDSFLKAIGKYDVGGVSLRDLGDTIASDRKRTDIITREQAQEIIEDSFAKLEAKYPLLVSGGNFYSLGYSSDLINVPLAHNALYIVDQEIPFYEMLLHGYVSYSGSPINLSDSYDEDQIALRLIEYGASPHFTFTAEDSSEMKYTGLNRLYSTTFTSWKDTAQRVYSRVDEALSTVSGKAILKHESLGDTLKRVTYEGGIQIYINYADSDVSYDGVSVGRKSFAVKEGAA